MTPAALPFRGHSSSAIAVVLLIAVVARAARRYNESRRRIKAVHYGVIKIARLAFCTWLPIGSLTSTAFGDLIVSYSMTGTASFDFVTQHLHQADQRTESGDEGFVELAADGEVSRRGVHGSASIYAGSQAGQLQVWAQAGYSAPSASDLTGGAITPNVRATWSDTYTVVAPNTPPGTQIELKAKLRLEGEMATSASGKWCTTFPCRPPFSNASSSVFLQIEGPGVATPPHSGSGHIKTFYAYQHECVGCDVPSIVQLPPPKVSLTHVKTVGEPFDFSLTMRLVAQASVGNFSSGSDASAFTFGEFFRTLAWDGIESVTNAATGEPIEGWSITSASGFDYSRPFRVIPEPSSLWLIGVALTAGQGLMLRRRRPA